MSAFSDGLGGRMPSLQDTSSMVLWDGILSPENPDSFALARRIIHGIVGAAFCRPKYASFYFQK